jgi:transposase
LGRRWEPAARDSMLCGQSAGRWRAQRLCPWRRPRSAGRNQASGARRFRRPALPRWSSGPERNPASETELLLTETPRRLEVFIGAGRRRSWTAEQKAQIVAECDEAGASVSAVARHGLTPQQLFGWRRDARGQAEEASDLGAPFAPVVVNSGAPISPTGRKSRPIEVVIGSTTVRVPAGTDIGTSRPWRRCFGP